MKKTSILLVLALLALGAASPAYAQAAAGGKPSASLRPIDLGASQGAAAEEAEGEEGQEGEEEELEEGEGEEGEEEAEAEGAARSQRHGSARHGRALPRLTSLALTHAGLQSLRRRHPRVSSVSFVFTLTTAAKTAAVLQTQSRAAGHAGWHTISQITLTGKRGANVVHLSAHATLPAGYARLTLTPAHGARRTIAFRVA
jgi:hypothetical protein